MSSLRKRVLSDPARRRDLAAIHVAKKQLGMDDGTYRDMLWSVARVRSSSDLDFAGRKSVLDHLRKCGFKSERPAARDPQSRKIRSMWLQLKDLGALRDPSEKALNRYVENQTGVKALQWLSSEQASKVIESLKSWHRRELKKVPREASDG
jgi:phage gp16-like protein